MGPLKGLKIIELAGIGPCPMAAMMLADLGATVLRIAPPVPSGVMGDKPSNFLLRNRTTIKLDLKQKGAVAIVMELVRDADAVIEGFRPGVAERLGLGPDDCLAAKPSVVYGRVTGWGQSGPLHKAAGHDLNYIAVTGALSLIGREGQAPTPPVNLVGDFGAGALYLVTGVLSAIIEARTSGCGQVVDAAVVDGAVSLMTAMFGMHQAGLHNAPRGQNILDSGAYFYETYECADGKYISVAAIEKRFHDNLLTRIGLDPVSVPSQDDRSQWPSMKAKLAAIFKQKTRDVWCSLLEGSDACFAPVMDLDEAPSHPHLRARETFITVDGLVQPGVAPRFTRTIPLPPKARTVLSRENAQALLTDWSLSKEMVSDLGALASA